MAGLLIVGAGGHGKVVLDTAILTKRWDKIGFLDDKFPEITSVIGTSVLGKTGILRGDVADYCDLVVAIGDNERRLQLIKYYRGQGFNIVTIVHPNAYVSPVAKLDIGTVVFANATINIGTSINTGCIINTNAVIDHDCKINKGVHICPRVCLAGHVTIGELSWIGIGSTVIQEVTIGHNVIVGAGAVIITDVPDNVTIIGVPGRVTKSRSIQIEDEIMKGKKI